MRKTSTTSTTSTADRGKAGDSSTSSNIDGETPTSTASSPSREGKRRFRRSRRCFRLLAPLRKSSFPASFPNRKLSEHERDLMVRWCDRDSDSMILEARQLFNATIVAINPSPGRGRPTRVFRLLPTTTSTKIPPSQSKTATCVDVEQCSAPRMPLSDDLDVSQLWTAWTGFCQPAWLAW